MIIPITVVVVVVILFLLRWSWRAMKRSPDPAVQKSFKAFNEQVTALRQALLRLLVAWQESLND